MAFPKSSSHTLQKTGLIKNLRFFFTPAVVLFKFPSTLDFCLNPTTKACSRFALFVITLLAIKCATSVPIESPCGSAAAPAAVSGTDIGVVMSDTDGAGPILYDVTQPRTCLWRLTCNASENVAVRNVAGVLVSDGFSNAPLDWLYVGPNISLCQTLAWTPTTFPTATLDVSFVVSATTNWRKTGWSGFSLSFGCMPRDDSVLLPIVGCPRVPFVINANRGVLLTDPDGVGPQFVQWRAPCLWRIVCLAPTNLSTRDTWIQLNISKSTTTVLLVSSTEIDPPTAVGDVSFTSTLLPSSSVLVILPSYSFTQAGASFSFACVDATVRAADNPIIMTCPSVAAPQVLSYERATIMGDIDGDGPALYSITPRTCKWQIACPNPNQVVWLDTVVGSLSTSLDFSQYDTLQFGDLRWHGAFPSNKNFATRSPNITVSFIVTAFSSSRFYIGPGWRLQYSCRNTTEAQVAATPAMGCPVASPTVVSNQSVGVLLTDTDGAGSYPPYALYATCLWRIVCPATAAGAVSWIAMNISIRIRVRQAPLPRLKLTLLRPL